MMRGSVDEQKKEISQEKNVTFALFDFHIIPSFDWNQGDGYVKSYVCQPLYEFNIPYAYGGQSGGD
jgi:hypothetical protein